MPPTKGDVAYYEGNIVEFTVASGQTIEKGDVVAITGDWEISLAVSTEYYSGKAIGVALNAGTEGKKVEVLTMAPIVYVVNQGGVTAGDFVFPSITVAGAVSTINLGQSRDFVAIGIVIEGAGDGETFPMALIHAICRGSL